MNDYQQRRSGLWVPRSFARQSRFRLGGTFIGRIVRDGRTIDEFEQANLVVNQGLDNNLGVYLCGVAQTVNWYMAPFSGNYQPSSTDTAATIVGNATEATAYTSSTRVAYQATEANQTATNAASPATFTFNNNLTIYGAMLVSSSGKQSTSGILFAATQFSSPKNVANGDQLLLTYAVSAAAS